MAAETPVSHSLRVDPDEGSDWTAIIASIALVPGQYHIQKKTIFPQPGCRYAQQEGLDQPWIPTICAGARGAAAWTSAFPTPAAFWTTSWPRFREIGRESC